MGELNMQAPVELLPRHVPQLDNIPTDNRSLYVPALAGGYRLAFIRPGSPEYLEYLPDVASGRLAIYDDGATSEADRKQAEATAAFNRELKRLEDDQEARRIAKIDADLATERQRLIEGRKRAVGGTDAKRAAELEAIERSIGGADTLPAA